MTAKQVDPYENDACLGWRPRTPTGSSKTSPDFSNVSSTRQNPDLLLSDYIAPAEIIISALHESKYPGD